MAALEVKRRVPEFPTLQPLAGVWLHSTSVINEILSGGWRPEENKNTMFGTGVYMSRNLWTDHKSAIKCVVDIREATRIIDFSGDATYDRFAKYISQEIRVGTSAAVGDSRSNVAIRDHFLQLGVQAVLFPEGADSWATLTGQATPVLVVYDLACIHVVGLLR